MPRGPCHMESKSPAAPMRTWSDQGLSFGVEESGDFLWPVQGPGTWETGHGRVDRDMDSKAQVSGSSAALMVVRRLKLED
jgi:hypothetical protein